MVVLFFSVCGDAASFASLQVCLPFFSFSVFVYIFNDSVLHCISGFYGSNSHLFFS